MRSYLWSEERTALLVKLWTDGFTASQVARELGTTRNAVCGKVDRLNLPERPGDKRWKGVPTIVPRAPRVRAPRKRLRASPADKASPAPRWTPAPRPTALVVLGPVHCMGDHRGRCKFPLWGNDRPLLAERFYCGEAAPEGSSYCRTHRGICYTTDLTEQSRVKAAKAAAVYQERAGA